MSLSLLVAGASVRIIAAAPVAPRPAPVAPKAPAAAPKVSAPAPKVSTGSAGASKPSAGATTGSAPKPSSAPAPTTAAKPSATQAAPTSAPKPSTTQAAPTSKPAPTGSSSTVTNTNSGNRTSIVNNRTVIGSGRSQTVIVNNHYSGGSMWAPYYTPGGGYFHSYYWPMTWTRHTVGGGVNPLGTVAALVFLIAILAIVGAGAWYGTRRIRR